MDLCDLRRQGLQMANKLQARIDKCREGKVVLEMKYTPATVEVTRWDLADASCMEISASTLEESLDIMIEALNKNV